MEIDEINLEDEQTSQVLLKYLNGEIPFHEWLNLQSGGNSNSDVFDAEIENTADGNVNEITDCNDDFKSALPPTTASVDALDEEKEQSSEDDLIVQEDAENSSADIFHPSIAKFPKKMTELLLMGKQPPAAKSVDEFMDEIPLGGKRRRRVGRRRLNELSDKHRRIMGEINLCYVRKDFDKAWNLCEDLIKKAPMCPEPFQTLAFICEEKNDLEKAHQYKLIAAHLGAADCEEWIELAQMSIKKENWEEALVCFTEASKQKPSIDILMAKAAIYDQLNQPKKKMEVFENILKIIPVNEGAKYFAVAKDVAQLYHESNQNEKAICTLEKAFRRYPQEIKFEDVNILTELQMSLRQFQKAFKISFLNLDVQLHKRDFSHIVICQYCDVELLQSESSDSQINVPEALTEEDLTEKKLTDMPLMIPEALPVDLRVKMIVCLIHGNADSERMQDVISPLFSEPIDEVGDLYLDIADAYCETGQYEEALVLLNPLVKTEQFGQAAVWLKKAQCLATLGRDEEASEAYCHVVSLAPGHSEARFTLSALYQRLGQTEKALQVLEEMPGDEISQNSDGSDEENDVEMVNDGESICGSTTSNSEKGLKQISHQELKRLYHRSLLLYSQKQVDGFLADGIQALSHYLSDVYFNDEVKSGNINRSFRFAIERLRKVADELPDSLKDQGGIVADIRREEWWELLVKVAKTLCKVGRFSEMEYIIKCAMSSARFAYFKRYQRELDYLGVTACYLNGSLDTAFSIIRVVINRNRDCKHLWNIFVRLIDGSGDSKHQKFCLRQLLKDPHSFPLQMINGHNALISGNYKYALGEYARVFRQKPEEPLISMSIALSYLQLACQRFTIHRNSHVVHAFLFFYQYENLRGRSQETDYNLGRGYHQLGLLHFASHYYHKALEYPFVGDEKDEVIWEKNNLHREAAYNLSLIYRYSGNMHVARELIQKYCTI